MIQITIDVDKIPKDKIWTGKNGGKKLFATLAERRETTQYGETHTLYLYDKDTKEKTYIGSGKLVEWQERGQAPQQPQRSAPAPQQTYDDGLPF
jgi:hypothetical protein